MTKLFAIVLCALVFTWAIAGPYQTTLSAAKVSSPSKAATEEHNKNDSQLPEGQRPLSAPAPDAEEEFDDKDETSKEKVLQRVTTISLTSILEELYQRQLLVFDEHQPEVDTPPPKS
jgi:hypothetical protein